jgi:hypothetical protein
MGIVSAMMQVGAAIKHAVAALFKVTHSLRFDGTADYFAWSDPPASNRTTNTFSFWFKPMENAVNNAIFFQQRNTGSTKDLQFLVMMRVDSGRNGLRILDQDNSDIDILLDSGADIDFEAGTWYHVVVAVNTNEVTNTNRVKVWIDGQQYTTWSSPTWPGSGYSTGINRASTRMLIGVQRPNTSSTLNTYSNVQLAEYHFIDGQALDASYFGETNASNQWVPKEVTGVTYGTNGFYLPFSTPSSDVNAFNAVAYTGDGVAYTGDGSTSNAVTGVGFSPDLVWAKVRDTASSHALFDTVRGVQKRLRSDTTGGEATQNGVMSFDADGFTLGDNLGVNRNGSDFIAWCWKAGGEPTSSNSATSGSAMVDGVATTTASIASAASASITPTKMSVNTDAGFSIISYEGNETSGATVPHGLDHAPEFVIAKQLGPETNNWDCFHIGLDATNPAHKHIYLNEPNGVADNINRWNDTPPSSSVVTLGNGYSVNRNTRDYIMYCFHSVSGYSKIGSYSGSGGAGNKVTTGFKPAFVIVKSTGSNNWVMLDNARSPTNPADDVLYADSSVQEPTPSTATSINFLADGFDFGGGGSSINGTSTSYIYMAFADTSPNLGLDATTNTNNFAVNGNITPDDQLIDSPNLRFASFDPGNKGANVTLSEANFNSVSSSGYSSVITTETIPTGSKIYCEWTCDNSGALNFIGIGPSLPTGYVGDASTGWGLYMPLSTGNLEIYNSASAVTTLSGSGPAAPHVAMMAVDRVNNVIHFGYNGLWRTTTTATATLPAQAPVQSINANGTYYIVASPSTSRSVITNLGQDHTFAGALSPLASPFTDSDGNGEFYYQPPSGFKALATSY